MCAQEQQMTGIATHPLPGLPVLARGATKSMLIGCLAKRVVLQKGFCGVANACRAARPFVFLCFVLCALQLLHLQINAHDVKTLIRFLRSLIVRARYRLLGADRCTT